MSLKAYKLVRILTWTIGGISLIIFYVWFEYLKPSLEARDSPTEQIADAGFNRYVWLQGKDNLTNNNPRRLMYPDLVEKHLAKGLTKASIEEKLSQPDHLDKDGIYYYLIDYDFNTSKFDYLVLNFDQDDKLQMYYRKAFRYALK
ncbi:hypothetical protein [Catenovulum maritimum]|uniref:Uncharacterized protein n=1 Tax=Catenovulum maritimum TaxID=1513271 RepID=A0A0J8GV04_9ALTE|nr:hypothetical protein [Catenovulum maritimum]KMT65134.1 hypothetical protein XM47_10370 [Catenovulum maritimum]